MIPESARVAVEENQSSGPINFLWLELTNMCNLACAHCYSDSSPKTGYRDRLTITDYREIISKTAESGCKAIQFIGGEPTVNNALPELIEHAIDCGYEFVEIFSNLIRLPSGVMDAMARHRGIVHVATSVYSSDAKVHDEITGKEGSFFATTRNIDRISDMGIPIRAAFVEMDANAGHAERTFSFLKERGVQNVSYDKMRQFGRGERDPDVGMEELCGECAGKTLCIGADGKISPCIMSNRWAVANVLDDDLDDVIQGVALRSLRNQIGEAVAKRKIPPKDFEDNVIDISMCNPCTPYAQCGPCPPNTNCPPHNCNPWYGR